MKRWLKLVSAVTAGLLLALVLHDCYQRAESCARRMWRDAVALKIGKLLDDHPEAK